MRLFRIHLAGVTLSNLSDGILAGAVPLIAVTLTRDPLLIGLLSTAMWLPWLLGALVIGVVVDRTDRARVRRLALAARACVAGGALAAALADLLTIWVLLAFVVGYAVTEVFADLAAGALVPDLVPRQDLPRANARVMGAETLMQSFVGAPIGGALVVLGAAWAFGSSMALALLVVLVLAGLRRPGGFRASHDRTAGEDAQRVRDEILEGLRVVARHPVVRPFTISAGLTNFANTAYFSVFVLWAVGPGSAIGLEEWQYPWLAAAIAAGAILGSLVPTSWLARAGEVRVMIGCWLLNSTLLLVPVLAPTWYAVAAAFVLMGMTNMVGNVIGMSIRQRVVPSRLLGRVGGASRTVVFGAMALGGPVGGLLARQLGLASLFVAMTALAVLVTLWVATQVDQDIVDRAEAEATPEPAPTR